ncbi:hypothetical protein ACOSP7_009563 [Xanthoceras sorbifolium]
MDSVGDALVVMVPKVKIPVRVSEFRPISLCNVIYKLIAKALANRLKIVLGYIITLNQSAFVLGRLITDNVTVGFECLHHLKNNMYGFKGFAAFKLNMSKANDRME